MSPVIFMAELLCNPVGYIKGAHQNRVLVAIAATGHDELVTLSELDIMSYGLLIVPEMPALHTVQVIQHVILYDPCLLS